jgi:hypothetical protein
LVAPRGVFARIEDTPAYGPTLVLMLGVVMLLGYAEVQTGLIDRSVDVQTEAAIAHLEKDQAHLVDRVALREQMDTVREGGEFNKMISRLMAIGLSPVKVLATLLTVAAVLYAIVALTGRKPEWHTLMGICTYAGVIGLVAVMLRMAMVIAYRTIDVDTSLAMLAPPGKPSWMSAIDPFRVWFWVLVGTGLIVTRQLGPRLAIASCVAMALIAGGIRAATSFSMTG